MESPCPIWRLDVSCVFLWAAWRKKRLHPRLLVTWQVSLTGSIKSRFTARRGCVVIILTDFVCLCPSPQICAVMTQTTLLLFSSTHSRSLSRWASYFPVDVNDTSLSFSITKQVSGTPRSTVPSCGVMCFCKTTSWLQSRFLSTAGPNQYPFNEAVLIFNTAECFCQSSVRRKARAAGGKYPEPSRCLWSVSGCHGCPLQGFSSVSGALICEKVMFFCFFQKDVFKSQF